MRKVLVRMALLGVGAVMIGCGRGASSDNHQPDSMNDGRVSSVSIEATGNHHHPDSSESPATNPHSTRLIFDSQPSVIPVGQPANWRLKVVDDASGKPIGKFNTVHERLLHLIVVSSDLSWFNHLHPVYNGNGEFTVTTTLPRSGSYKLYADYTPEGRSQEVQQQVIATDGQQPMPIMVLPFIDSISRDGWIIKRVSAISEGNPDTRGGAEYEVALMPMPGKLIAGQDAMLHFQVRDGAGKPVNDLEPYLGALGHAVILSSDTKTYLHTHPMEGGMEGMKHGATGEMNERHEHPAPTSGGPDVAFHTNFPRPGLYKVWGQFQHNGKIVIGAFVVSVAPQAT